MTVFHSGALKVQKKVATEANMYLKVKAFVLLTYNSTDLFLSFIPRFIFYLSVMGLKCASCCIHPFYNTAVGHERNKCNHSTSGNVGQLGRDKLVAMEDSRIPYTADTYQGRTSG